MDIRSSLEALAERGEQRGAEDVFRHAVEDGDAALVSVLGPNGAAPTRPPRGQRRALVAALVAVVALTAGVVASLGDSGGDVAVDPAAIAPSEGPVVLALPVPPAGLQLEAAFEREVTVRDGRSPGSLSVWQQETSDGSALARVLAVGVSGPGEFNVLDILRVADDQVTEDIAGRSVVRGEASGEDNGLAAPFGHFDVARWTEGHATVTVASRNLTPLEISDIVRRLDLDGGAPALPSSAVPPGLVDIDVDATLFPTRPLMSDGWTSYTGADGAELEIGTVQGDWPSARQALWWFEGGRLAGRDQGALVAGDIVYRTIPGGAATALARGLDADDVADVLSDIKPISVEAWRASTGGADRSRLETGSTTPLAPPGPTGGG